MIEAFVTIYVILGIGIVYGMREELAKMLKKSYFKVFLVTALCVTAWPLMIIAGFVKDKLY